VLITGGSGTFGYALARQLLVTQRPNRLVIFSRSEHRQAEMKEALSSLNEEAGGPLRFFLGDICDRDRLIEALRDVEFVFHAAAMKRIEACEYNSREAVRTNVIGAEKLIDACLTVGVERVLGISTDKAVAPTTLYGVTKAMMEKMFSASNARSGYNGPRLATVRYGNVLGSNGSVLPKFFELAMAGEVLPITDLKMTRFTWPIDDAIAFTLGAMDEMIGGEVLVPKMASMRLTDLIGGISRALGNRQLLTKVVGFRPAEKLHEVLITAEEAPSVHDLDGMYAVSPDYDWMPRHRPRSHSTKLYAGGDYHSGLEHCLMSAADATQMVVDVLRSLYELELPDEPAVESEVAACGDVAA
jgi:UDP-N-acetylglucosamine 4,6-dehydratase